MKNLLINRTFNVQGNWYAPQEIINDYKSVKISELLNTCSSAGDWDGLFAQELNGKTYIIPFYQENNYPRSGFTLYTGDVFCKIDGKLETRIEFDDIVQEYCEMIYN
jgi:hypothetical protein